MSRSLLVVSLLLGLTSLIGCAAAPAHPARPVQDSAASRERPPNIILFVVDDLGWQDVALPLADHETPLNRRYRTPNLVRMATEGMKFTNAYAAGPVCSPTRVTLITGRFPAESKVTAIVGGPRPESNPVLLPPQRWNVNGLSPAADTPLAFSGPLLPKILRDSGYKTIHVGKGHWGKPGTPGADPLALGFDVNIGGSGAGLPGSYQGENNYRNRDGQDAVPHLDSYHGTDTFLTEALTIEANRAIDQAVAEKRPFFLHFAQFAVHTPLNPDMRFVMNNIELVKSGANEVNYATLVEGMDKSLGDVLANITRHGLDKTTLVVFVSDNGASSEARKRGINDYNAPLRGAKGTPYEGGIRIPLVVKWPGHVRPGSISSVPVITDDLFATALAVGNVAEREKYVSGIRGKDLTPMLTGGDNFSGDRPLLWHYPHEAGFFSALRVGQWKLIFHYKTRQYELFNLVSDLSESSNVLDANRSVGARLSQTLREGLSNAGAQTPYDPVTMRDVALPPPIVP